MRRYSRLLAAAGWLVCCVACAMRIPSADDPAAIELVAVRALLGSYRPNVLSVDSLFAVPGQAPPSMTSTARPSNRHRALFDSLRPHVTQSGGYTLRVRASNPVIRGSRATISVTVDGVRPVGRRGGFYETVEFTLERRGATWVIRDRVQLGVS